MSANFSQLQKIVRAFRGQAVGILGDFMLDELIQGQARRISPEAPVPVILLPNQAEPQLFLGGAGNVVANVASLGGRAVPFGVLGKDETGSRVLELLRKRRVNTRAVVHESDRITPRKTRIVAHQQQLLRLDRENPRPLSASATKRLTRSFLRALSGLKALIVSDYNKGCVTRELMANFLSLARQRRVPVFVDPKPENIGGCRRATLVAPNLMEAEVIAGMALRDRASLEAAGRRLKAELECDYLLVTRGGEGMTLFDSKDRVTHIPAETRPVYDVTGAGDTVMATLALAFAAGASMLDAVCLANLAGQLAVLQFGTAQVTADQLLDALSRQAKAKS